MFRRDDKIIMVIFIDERGLEMKFTASQSAQRVKLDAFGAELDPHFFNEYNRADGFNEDDWKLICSRIRDMRLHKIRMMIMPEWFEPNKASGGHFDIDFNDFDWDNQYMYSVYRTLDMAQEYGIKVNLTLWGAWASHGSWLAYKGLESWVTAPNDNDEWSKNFCALLKYLTEVRGYTCITDITPYNEPADAYRNADGRIVYEEYEKMVRNLDMHLKRHGLRDKVQLCLSDDGTKPDWAFRCIKRMADISERFNCHCYRFSSWISDDMIYDWNDMHKLFINTYAPGAVFTYNEFGSDAYIDSHNCRDTDTYDRALLYARMAVNFLNSGCNGMIHWCLFDENYGSPKRMNVGLMRFKDSGWSARPIYYVWSLITRYTVPGSEIYPLSCDASGAVRATALKAPDGKWTVLATNFSDCGADIELELENADGFNFRRHTVSESTLPDDSNIVPFDKEFEYGSGICQTVPPKGFVVLTQIS